MSSRPSSPRELDCGPTLGSARAQPPVGFDVKPHPGCCDGLLTRLRSKGNTVSGFSATAFRRAWKPVSQRPEEGPHDQWPGRDHLRRQHPTRELNRRNHDRDPRREDPVEVASPADPLPERREPILSSCSVPAPSRAFMISGVNRVERPGGLCSLRDRLGNRSASLSTPALRNGCIRGRRGGTMTFFLEISNNVPPRCRTENFDRHP